MPRIPISEFSPDMPALDNPGSGNIMNCIPRTDKSYGPFQQMQDYGGALTTQCQGAYSCIDSSANVYVFAGDSQNLWEYTAASTTPSKVSNGTNPYTIGSEERWNFSLFGQRVVATDFNDPIQSFVLGTSSTFAPLANGSITTLTLVPGSGYTNGTYALTVSNAGIGTGFAGTVTVSGGTLSSFAITNMGKNYPQTATIAIPAGAGAGSLGSITPTIQTIAPQARYSAVVKGFLCVANTTDPVNGAEPQRVWWSAQNDPTDWPTPGTATAAQFQSSFNDLFGEGGWIKGIVGGLGTSDGAVFQQHMIWSMVYVGPPVVFDFFPVEGVRGTEAPASIAQLGGIVYYYGEDGVYAFDGTNSIPIGFEKVDKYIQATLNSTYISNMIGAIDPINKLYLLAYPSINSGAGTADTILAYHWPTKKWALIQQNCEFIFRALTFGNNVLDTVGSVSLDTASYNMFQMDSGVWQGDAVIMAGFDTNHKLAYFNGGTMAAVLDTTETEPTPGQLTLINGNGIRPLVDGSIPSVAFGVRNRQQDPVIFNTATPINFLGECPQMVNGRFLRAEITIPANTSWTHCQGLSIADDGIVANGRM